MRPCLAMNVVLVSLLFTSTLTAQGTNPPAPIGNPPTPSATTPIAQTVATPQTKSLPSGTEQLTPVKAWYEVAAMFAWPSVALFALLLFRTQLIELLSAMSRQMRMARVKMLGVEFEIAHIQNTEQFKAHSKNIGEKPDVSGDPNVFKLLCKASNARLAKSTKVMNLTNGCLVQVSTREVMGDNSVAVAEAIAFVPDLNVQIEKTLKDRKPERDEQVIASFVRIANNVA